MVIQPPSLCQSTTILEVIADEVAEQQPVELACVAETLNNAEEIWATCSGCHESNEGVPTEPYSQILKYQTKKEPFGLFFALYDYFLNFKSNQMARLRAVDWHREFFPLIFHPMLF